MNGEFLYQRRVQFAETDLVGIVHFSWYFRYMEEAEHALWRAAGLRIAHRDEPLGWPRVAAAFDYKAPLRFEEEFVVAVRIGMVSRRTIQYAFTLRRGGAVVGNGTLTAACASELPGGGLQSREVPPAVVERLRAAIEAAGGEA